MEVISQNVVYFVVVLAIMALLFVWAYLTGRMQKDFSTMTWVLIPVAIAINLTSGRLSLSSNSLSTSTASARCWSV